jgi:hypothetical protein
MIITKKDGTPFPTLLSAKGRIGLLSKKDGIDKDEYKIIEQDGGYVVESPDPTHEAKDDGAMEIDVSTEKSKEIDRALFQATGDWKPSKLLDIPVQYKDPGFTYRWCNTLMDGNIDKKQSEGWIIDEDVSLKRRHIHLTKSKIERDFHDNSKSLGRETMLRELILMKMPNDMAAKRNKYYRDKATANITHTKEQFSGELQKHGSYSYGNVDVTR